MKKFDWEYHKKTRSEKYHNFLLETYDLAISEDVFAKEYKKLKGTQHPISKGRREYKNLKTKFGFFQ